jgi:hypothetical protein
MEAFEDHLQVSGFEALMSEQNPQGKRSNF